MTTDTPLNGFQSHPIPRVATEFDSGKWDRVDQRAHALFDALVPLGQTPSLVQQAKLTEAIVLLGRRDPVAAVGVLASWVSAHPEDALAHCTLGLAQRSRRHPRSALSSLQRALALAPDYGQAHILMGRVLGDLGLHKFAVLSFERAAVLLPGNPESLRDLGQAFIALDDYQAALDAYRRAAALDPNLPYLRGLLLEAKTHLALWQDIENEIDDIEVRIRRREPVIPPFVSLTTLHSQQLQRMVAETWYRDFHDFPPILPPIIRRNKDKRLRIGYFCADFYAHPLMSLLAELFEAHDRGQFEIHGFSLGRKRSDPVRKRLEQAFDYFHDVSDACDREVALLSRSLEIDIAVDLAGYTSDCRPDIFGLRAAPVQASFECFTGTLGAPFFEYIIADRTVLPPSDQCYFSEKVVYLPYTYLTSDTTRHADGVIPSRDSLGLPNGRFIFCCFNSNHKITGRMFECWMRILHKVPNSVLWLYFRINDTADRILEAAETCGISRERLIFAPYAPLNEHLARLACADLFLDTLPYNGHTTSIDALYAGLPVLTCRGTTFPGRVAASALSALDLPELVADSLLDYENRAIELGLHQEKFHAVLNKLVRNKCVQPLFNTTRFTRGLESAYEEMHRIWINGMSPRFIEILETQTTDAKQ